jgi:hypothetical protein
MSVIAMTSDLRTFVARDLRLHPRVAYQGMFCGEEVGPELASSLPPMPPFRSDYYGAISVIDWDHRLPSQGAMLRVYAYYTESAYAAGEEAFDDRLEEIGLRDKFPEFDVPDFDHIAADEAYDIELDLDGEIGRCRLTSAWRRSVDPRDAGRAVQLAAGSDEFARLVAEHRNRPTHLGDLEAVSWTPPCESQHTRWTLDVWYLLSFDGRVGSGRSFLVDLDTQEVVLVRDFSVRTA